MVTVHVPVPPQTGSQPPKMEPAAGCAVSVTAVSGANSCWHWFPQSIPVGLLVTVPVPVPLVETERLKEPGGGGGGGAPTELKVAVSVFAPLLVMRH